MKNKKKEVSVLGVILLILLIISVIIFVVNRRKRFVDGNWYQTIRVEKQEEKIHIVHYNGNTYYPIDKEDIPINEDDQDWDYTHDILLREPKMSLLDYIPIFDFARPWVSVLVNQKDENENYVYVSVLIGETTYYYKLSDE